VAKEPELLLEVDVDAAEEDAILADVGFVCANGSVGRDEDRVMPEFAERGDECVVAQTTAALHPGRAGGDGSDAHPDPHCEYYRAGCGFQPSIAAS
jgi:hypothetical protein